MAKKARKLMCRQRQRAQLVGLFGQGVRERPLGRIEVGGHCCSCWEEYQWCPRHLDVLGSLWQSRASLGHAVTCI